MIAFLMFFYFFIFVSLFVAITSKKDVTVLHIKTKDLTHYPIYDNDNSSDNDNGSDNGSDNDSDNDNDNDASEDKSYDDMEIDEDEVENFSNDELDNDYNQVFQVEMKTKIKDEKILYELHSYLSENKINEETNIMTVEGDDILWDIKYNSNAYEKFYDALIEYINENFLSENLVVFMNGKKLEPHLINLIK